MNTDTLIACLRSLNDAVPQLMAAERQAMEARLRQEGAIMIIRDLLRQPEHAPAQEPLAQEEHDGHH